MTVPRSPGEVGRSNPRVDGAVKVTGALSYVDDITYPGLLHGATVRSDVPHATLVALDRDPTFDWSDTVVVTAADIPGRNVLPLFENDQPVLVPVGGTVRHAHEPLALVAAPTRKKALAAAQALRATTRSYPAVLSLDAALNPPVPIHGDDNVFAAYDIHHGDAIDAVLAACDWVVEGTYRTGAQEQMYIEPQGMIARFEEDVCHVEGSMQCPFYIHKALPEILGLPPERLHVSHCATGGGFGGKEEYPSMIAAHAALLAQATKRPVKLVYERDEDLAATTKRHPARVYHRLGGRADGTVVACDIDVVIDGGAYMTLTPVVLQRAVLHASGPYRFEHARIRGRAVATHQPPFGAFRGFGAPQVTFAYERQMHKAARRLGIEPWEMRRRNVLRLGDTTTTGQKLDDSVGSIDVLDAVQERLQKQPAPPSPERSRTVRGRGLACCFHGAGFTGDGESVLAAKVQVAALRGGFFEIRSASTEMGQGALTTFTQLAADGLGVTPDRIRIARPETAVVPDSGPTVASRTCMVVGRLVDQAARGLRRRIEEQTAGGEGSGGTAERAAAWVAREGPVVEEADYRSPASIAWDEKTLRGAAYPVFGWACCWVEVTVDLDTYEVAVERCVHAVDVGKAIHPVIVAGQIDGGTLQALGWALWENVVYEKGRMANNRMTTCIIPTFADAPELETLIVEVPYRHGPHGAKGMGEIPMDGPAAAVAAAVEDAVGMPCDQLPIQPEDIARYLER